MASTVCRPVPPASRWVRLGRAVAGLPPTSYFLTSALFHYLGPSLAVLLFAHLAAVGVAWLRIAAAAVFFAAWRRPWRVLAAASRRQRSVLLGLGLVLAAMNTLFYLAIDRLPLSTVGAIEFLGVVVLGHRVANTTVEAAGTHQRDPRATPMSGIDQLGAAMLIAAVAATPFGISAAVPAFTHPLWLAWGVGVGLCSSVIPYVTDQLAMTRLPRATFALMLALLPAAAALIGLVVLGQVPTLGDLAGIGLVIAGVALHQRPPDAI